MLVLEVMSLFMLGLLGSALHAGDSDDDEDEDRSEDGRAEADARAAATEDSEAEGEGGSLLDHVFAEELDFEDEVASPDAAQVAAGDPWQQEAEDAAYEAAREDIDAAAEAETYGKTDRDVLDAVDRLTATSDATAQAPDEDQEPVGEQPDDRADALALLTPDPLTATAPEPDPEDEAAEADTGDEDGGAAAPGNLSATTIVDYQPGSDQIEITIFAPAPDTAVDVVLQQTENGSGTEVLIDGKLRAILDGVLPGDVDANDLFIEFAG